MMSSEKQKNVPKWVSWVSHVLVPVVAYLVAPDLSYNVPVVKPDLYSLTYVEWFPKKLICVKMLLKTIFPHLPVMLPD